MYYCNLHATWRVIIVLDVGRVRDASRIVERE